MKSPLLLVCVLQASVLAFSSPASAEDDATASGTTVPVNLDIHAQVRHRWEIDGRAKFDPDATTTEFSLLRSRLSVGAELPKGVTLFLQGQDSRTWGEEPSTLSGTGSTGEMHQGYFTAGDLFAPGVWAKVGRFEMMHGNERLVGAVDFSNTGRAFDGVIFGYDGASYGIQLFETKIAESVGDPTRGQDRDFFGAHATVQAAPMHDIEVFGYYDHDQDTLSTGEDAVKRLTFGGRAHGTVSGLAYDAEAAVQSGDIGTSSISASLLAGRVMYEVASNAYRPHIGVGLDMLSGDSDPNDDEVGVFHTLFPTNHKFYGLMDFFVDIPTATAGAGLVDFMIEGGIAPSNRLKARASFHSFQSAEDLMVTIDGDQTALSSFGTEFDVVADITCTENVGVQGVFGAFAPGEIFDTEESPLFRGPDSVIWAYLQTTVSY